MRDLGRMKRNAWLSFAGAAVVLAIVVATAVLHDFDAPGTPGNLLVLSLLSLLLFAFLLLVANGGMAAVDARRFGRLARGEGVVARWTVDAETWRQRLVERRLLDAQPGVTGSYHVMPSEAPPTGVDIVVCDDAVFVGPRDMYPLSKGYGIQWRVQDSWLELLWLGHDSYLMLRLPVVPGAEDEAERVVQHFSQRGS